VIDERPEPICFLRDARGIFLPRDFTCNVERSLVANVSDEDWAALEAGPDHTDYLDAWSDVCDSAIVTDIKGVKYHVYQDGDCWLIPVGMTWDEETDWWRWP
jgi:hypothetical protein